MIRKISSSELFLEPSLNCSTFTLPGFIVVAAVFAVVVVVVAVLFRFFICFHSSSTL